MGRKLLYHRGIDDSIGTYLTDYAQFVASFCLSLCLFIIIYKQQLKCSRIVKPSSFITAVLLMSFAFMALFGGLTHQYLQQVVSTSRKQCYICRHSMGNFPLNTCLILQINPYSTTDGLWVNWLWLVIWRIASSFAAIACLCFLLLAYQLVCIN